MKSSKALTPRSIMNQKKALESRGIAKGKVQGPSGDEENKRPGVVHHGAPESKVNTRSKTPGAAGDEENRRPPAPNTPSTPTSHSLWRGHHTSRRDPVTPLGLSGKANRRGGGTPSTPTRRTPGKTQAPTPTRENLLITPGAGERPVSISHTSSVQVEPSAPARTPASATPARAFNRSRSASSLLRSARKAGSRSGGTAGAGGAGSGSLRRSVSEARLPGGAEQDVSSTCEPPGDGGELSRLSVGVRVRPLQPREHGNTVTVEGKEVRVNSDLGMRSSFVLDHVFGSGASQEELYTSMVRPLVDSAFHGYNACLFAYGQTGSGKTYSMMGSQTVVNEISDSTGIIPRFCHEIIDRVANFSHDSGGDQVHTSVTVEVSYLEVYNEKIRDLLVGGSGANLRVREHPVHGPYVADLSRHSVNTTAEIQHWISEGNKQRAMAATEMNEKSSRSHALFMVILTQSVIQSDDMEGWSHESTRRSQISLVDLAGSERIAHSSVSSDRLREGVSINRSLMTLGKVISALVDKRSFVPYRESVLTWLLKESLGGNSRTAMLATVSPCSSHQEETMATLRYAAQARTILNTVRVNESPQNKIIRELRAEIERLKNYVEVEQSGSSGAGMESAGEGQDVEELRGRLAEAERLREEAEKGEAAARRQAEESMDKNSNLRRDYDELKARFKELADEQAGVLNICSEKESTADSFKRRAQSAQNECLSLQAKLSASEEEVVRLSGLVQQLLEQKSSWADKLEVMENSVLDWKKDLEERQRREEALRKRAEDAEELVRSLTERLTRAGDLEREVETWQGRIAEVKRESERLAGDLSSERKDRDHWKGRSEETSKQLEESSAEVALLRTRLEQAVSELEELTRRRDEAVQELAHTSSELEDARETIRSVSVRVESTNSKISVSVQTSDDDLSITLGPVIPSPAVEVPLETSDLSQPSPDQTKEYLRLKKKIIEKKKKLECLNAKLMKFDSENKGGGDVQSVAEVVAKVKELEDVVRSQRGEMEEMSAELEVLRELEGRYRERLDRSLQDSDEAWRKKYGAVCEELVDARSEVCKLRERFEGRVEDCDEILRKELVETKCELMELKERFGESQKRVKELVDQLSLSNLERQVEGSEGESCAVATLERKNSDLQLRVDQKTSLILELERVANRAREEAAVAQACAADLRRQAELLESNLKEARNSSRESALRTEELEAKVRTLEENLKDSSRSVESCNSVLSDAKRKMEDLERSVRERDENIIQLHAQLVSVQKLLQETVSLKLDNIRTMKEEEGRKQAELDTQDALAVENLRLKSDLESTTEQLNRKRKRLEQLKSYNETLQESLVSLARETSQRKNYVCVKAEYAKMFECLMNHSYVFHWEYVLRKARSYAHKYHIPYEFERFDEVTAVVRNLLYNAKSYWFRIDFQAWFDVIEKEDRWSREFDEKLAWEVDFGSYYRVPPDRPGALCPLEESACLDIEPYCCKPGLICPGVWKRTIADRHLSGLQDDARCLLVYFKSSKNQDLVELLQVINNLASQVRDVLSTRPPV